MDLKKMCSLRTVSLVVSKGLMQAAKEEKQSRWRPMNHNNDQKGKIF